MATGIVSVAAWLEGLATLSDVLLAAAVLGWVALAAVVCLHVVERISGRPRLESFAFVAATSVLGARFAIAGDDVVALALWALAVAAWLVVLARRPELTRADGGWFLVVVGTESLAALAALLAPYLGAELLPAAVGWWALGLSLYPAVAAAIAVALRRRPRFGPDLWVTMGALSIATLAGTELFVAARALNVLGPLHPVLRDAAIATWALASAWIAPLLVAELRNRAGWRYRSSRWSFVFPLGMCAVATQVLGRAAGLAPLGELAHGRRDRDAGALRARPSGARAPRRPQPRRGRARRAANRTGSRRGLKVRVCSAKRACSAGTSVEEAERPLPPGARSLA